MKKVSISILSFTLLLFILLTQTIFALDITISSPEKGSTIESWGTYVFTVTDQPNQTADCTLNFNNIGVTAVQIKTNEQAAIKQLTPVGEINWSLHCVVNGVSVDSAIRPITSVDASPPEIGFLSPINATVSMKDTLLLNMSVKDSSKITASVFISAINRSYNRTRNLDEDHGFYVATLSVGKKFIPGNYILTFTATDEANRTINKSTELTIISAYGIAINQPAEIEEKKPIVLSGAVTDYSTEKVNNKEIELTFPNNEKINVPVTDGTFFYTVDSTGMTSGTITAEISDGQNVFSDSTQIVILAQQKVSSSAQNVSEPVVLEKVKTEIAEITNGTVSEVSTTNKSVSSVQSYVFIILIIIIILIILLVRHQRSKTFEADLYSYLRRRNRR